MSYAIIAIILPVPIFHLWLHALLPFWKKHPLIAYFLAGLIWVGSFFLMKYFDGISGLIFSPPFSVEIAGRIFMLVGLIGVLLGIYTLGLKRFFVWAVFRPNSVEQTYVKKGIYKFVSHPAYLGYLLAALGDFLYCGKAYLAVAFILLLALTPITIWLEEQELKKRISGI